MTTTIATITRWADWYLLTCPGERPEYWSTLAGALARCARFGIDVELLA